MWEVPKIGTCNNNNVYSGKMVSYDERWRPSVWIQNDGTWVGAAPADNYTVWHDYSYADNNSYSYIHLCINNFYLGQWYCGWGSKWKDYFTHQYYGVNHGF